MTGDFILQARVEFLGEGVDPHRKVGLMVRPTPGRRRALRRRRRPRRRPDVAAVPPHQGGDHRADGSPPSRAPTSSRLERKRQTYIFSAAKFGEPFTTSEIAGRRPRRRGAGRARALLAQRRRDRARDLQRRAHRPARRRTASCRIATTSAACSRSSTSQSGRRQVIYTLRAAVRGAELDDATAARSIYNTQRPRRGPRPAVSLRPRDASADAHRHRHQQPQQQRPRAVVRRHDARHQRPEPVRAAGRRSTPCRSAAARRSASRR